MGIIGVNGLIEYHLEINLTITPIFDGISIKLFVEKINIFVIKQSSFLEHYIHAVQ